MASSSVDFPLPFSPTKKHMRLRSSSSLKLRITGIVNGYSSQLETRSRSKVIFLSLGSEMDGTETKCLQKLVFTTQGLPSRQDPSEGHGFSHAEKALFRAFRSAEGQRAATRSASTSAAKADHSSFRTARLKPCPYETWSRHV